nr:unnamed protein product [Digitaria exilis]
MATRNGAGSGRKAGRRREWVRSGRRRRASGMEAREEASTGGVRRDGRDAMAAEMASGEGGGGLGPRRLRRKRCGVRRDRVENDGRGCGGGAEETAEERGHRGGGRI